MLESQKNDKCPLHIFWGTIILNRKEQYFKPLLQPSCHIVRKINAWIYLAFPRRVLRVEGLLLASVTEAQTCLSYVIGENIGPGLPCAFPKQIPRALHQQISAGAHDAILQMGNMESLLKELRGSFPDC